RVGRAAANRAPQQFGTVLRASTTTDSRHLKAPEMRTTIGKEIVDGPAEMAMQPLALCWCERARGPSRIEPGAPQHLVDEQVAKSGNAMLIHEASLQRRSAVIECRRQLRRRDPSRVDTEPGLVRVELDAAQPPGVVDAEVATVVEVHREPVPC